LSQSNQNTPYSKPSNGDDFALKEDHLGVDTTSPNTNDSSPPQHGIRGSEGHISGNLNKAIEGRQRAIAAGNQLKQDWLDAEHWRALANAHETVTVIKESRVMYHGGGCRKSSPAGQCCHKNHRTGYVHCH
jgi:hypothetical protein